MIFVHPFRKAGEADAVAALLAKNVAFTSRVAIKPYPGKAITATLVHGGPRVFEDCAYIREIAALDGHDHAFVVTATVDDKQLTGCDFLHFDRNGKIDDFMVAIQRPFGLAESGESWCPGASANAARGDRLQLRPVHSPRAVGVGTPVRLPRRLRLGGGRSGLCGRGARPRASPRHRLGVGGQISIDHGESARLGAVPHAGDDP
ncbi:hypothetical protein [Streptomyces tubercidicus]